MHDTIKKMIDLLAEVIARHADPEDLHHNDCDTNPCKWCKKAKQAIEDAKRLFILR